MLYHTSHTFSKCFQIADVDYSIIPPMVNTVLHSTEHLKTVDSVNLRGLPAFLEQLTNAGVDIKSQETLERTTFPTPSKIHTWIINIENRFDDRSVMAAFDIYNPEILPPLSINPDVNELSSFTDYGNDHVLNLAEQFQGVVGDSQECVEEWSSFKQTIVVI